MGESIRKLPSSPYNKLAQKYLPNGAGSLLTFGIKGGYEAGRTFINSVKLFCLLANIGDVQVAGDSSRFDDSPAVD